VFRLRPKGSLQGSREALALAGSRGIGQGIPPLLSRASGPAFCAGAGLCILKGPLVAQEDHSWTPGNDLRKAWADALCYALGQCHPDDAAAICAAFLAEQATDGPELAPWDRVTVEGARWWADIAPPHELAAYGMAALDRLRGTALGPTTRKRLFVSLWESFSDEERLRFVQRIDPEGLVIRRDND